MKFIKEARAQICPLVVSRAFLFTNNFWTCALGLLLRPACIFHLLQQRKSSCRFPKLVRHRRIENFNELSAETNVMDESDASSQFSGPILYSGR